MKSAVGMGASVTVAHWAAAPSPEASAPGALASEPPSFEGIAGAQAHRARTDSSVMDRMGFNLDADL
jgi:hypothetical protein